MNAAPEPSSTIDSEAPPELASDSPDRGRGASEHADHGPARDHRARGGGRGRSVAISVLVALAVFFLMLAWLLPQFVAPRLIELPANPEDGQNLVTHTATVLVPDLKSKTGVDVLHNATMSVNTWVSAPPVGDFGPDSVVWLLATTVNVGGHGMLTARVERVSFDKHTGQPNNCCGDSLVTDQSQPGGVPLVHSGSVVNFPFNLKKQDYPLWDIQLKKTKTARYLGDVRDRGMNLYEFRAVTPLTNLGTMDLPGSLFGSKAPSVKAVSQYADDKVMKVEPSSGTVVDMTDHTLQQYAYNGHVVTATDANLTLLPPSAKHLKQYQEANTYLPWLRGRISVVLVVLALAMLAGAFLLYRRRDRPDYVTY
jgi:hypothetical protein